ncbi:MAG: hypothetical protein IJU21_01470 [Bacteroidales bacterium]|nr:hypothetical protein [Bacteroidales bacterium]
MRRIVFILAAAAALLSCKKPLLDSMPCWYSRGPRSYMGGSTAAADSSAWNSPGRKGVYIAALRFPEWARWRDGDFRGAEAVLFRDSVEIARSPVGTRPDPERIHIVDGHLWTDIADNGETHIYCDGIHRLTLPEEELIRGFLAENDTIHTLGQRPGGGGVCYRVNGKEVFSHGAGSVIGTLQKDSAGTFFVYGIPIRKGDAVTAEYHIMNRADEIRTFTPNAGGAVYDILVREGTVYRSERRGENSSSLCLVIGDNYHSVGAGEGEDIHLCRLVELDGEMMIQGYSESAHITIHWIRSRAGLRHQVASGGAVPAIYACGDGIAHLITNRDGRVTIIRVAGTDYPLTEDSLCLKIAGPACADYKDGVFAAALSDTSGRAHRLFIGGRLVPLEFNGFFTSLKIHQ